MRRARCLNTVLVLLSVSICLQLFNALQRGDVTNPEQLFIFRKQLSDTKGAFPTNPDVHRYIEDMRAKCLNSTNTSNGTHPNACLQDEGDRGGNKSRSNVRTISEKIQSLRKEVSGAKVDNTTGRCYRTVQLWCQNSGELGFPNGVHKIECPESTCDVRLSVDMSFDTMQNNEALILYHWSKWSWENMYSRRPDGQKWVFYTLESPLHTRKHVIPPKDHFNDTYDYIMSFRYDSDFRADYGQYIDGRPELDASDNRNWAKNRTKLVAWMASNCGATSWPRKQFVNDLAKHVQVDKYGRCGDKKCKRGSKECDQTLAQYKFYLALENSECTDYITEKFWIQSFHRHLVPIVYGPTRSDYEKVAPPNSFIHVSDFVTLQDLATYIERIDKNDTLYNSFFDWKKRGSLKPYGGPNIMCQLGERLVRDEKIEADGGSVTPKHIDWKAWWEDSCQKRGEIPL